MYAFLRECRGRGHPRNWAKVQKYSFFLVSCITTHLALAVNPVSQQVLLLITCLCVTAVCFHLLDAGLPPSSTPPASCTSDLLPGVSSLRIVSAATLSKGTWGLGLGCNHNTSGPLSVPAQCQPREECGGDIGAHSVTTAQNRGCLGRPRQVTRGFVDMKDSL